MGSEITKLTTEVKELLAHSKKLEVDVAVVRNVNSKWVKKNVGTERQCWKYVQYSKRDTLEVVGIPGTMPLRGRFVTVSGNWGGYM